MPSDTAGDGGEILWHLRWWDGGAGRNPGLPYVKNLGVIGGFLLIDPVLEVGLF